MRALIAVDGSAAAEQAAVVADQILPVGAELLMLDVVALETPVLLGADGTGAMYAGRMLEDMERTGTERAARDIESAAEQLTDHDPEPLVDHGLVVDRVLSTAAEREVDLIVAGTADRSWWDRLWHGSVSRRLATEAGCSVLVVRSAAPIRRVLVAVDGSAPAETAARFVARLRLDDVETTVITIASPDDADDAVPGEPGPSEAYALVSGLGDRIQADSFTVAVDDAPIDALIIAAERHAADIVVVGTGDRGLLSRVLDESVSRHVLDSAPCSVMIAREPASPADVRTNEETR